MPTNCWTPAEDAKLIELELAYTPREQMVRELGRSLAGVTQRLRLLRGDGVLPKTRSSGGQRAATLPSFPLPTAPRYTDFLKLTGDWAVAPDWHCPAHSEDMATHLLDVSRTLGVRRLIITGDFLNADAYGKFDKVGGQSGFPHELEVAGRVVERLLEQFTEIVMSVGNHEERFIRANKEGECTFEHLIRLFGLPEGLRSRVRVNIGPTSKAAFRHLEVDNWRITHPKSFSIIPVRVAFRLASKLEKNVVCAHGHRAGVMMSENGKYVVIESGGMFDAERLGYCNAWDTVYPCQTPGFVVIRNGKAHVFGPWTDWDFWRGLRVAGKREQSRAA